METAPSSRRNRYVAIISIVLVVVALVVWMVIRLSAPSYNLNIASTAGGSTTTPGEGTFTYDEGTAVNLVAEAEEGYQFVSWTTGNVSTITDVNTAETTITMNGDYSITANFVAVYDLTISSTAGGSVTTPGEGTLTFSPGTVVSLVATPDAGYHFVNWIGDVGTIGNVEATTTTITMNDNYTIIANFAVEPQYSLIITSTEGGEVTEPGEGVFSYDEGTVVGLVAEAEESYQFVNWTGDVGTIADVNAAATTITMNGGYSITANFVAVYDLIISSTEGGSVSTPREGASTYDEGTVVNLVATPDAYYHFFNWTGDVGTIADVNAAATTITINSDYSITANFGVNPMVAAGDSHTVGLKSDGTVVAVGDGTFGRCNVEGWTDIVHVAAGGYHTVGLKADGTVVAVGRETAGQLNVDSWTDIVQVAAGEYYTLGLKADGTVVTVGSNGAGQCDVGGWTDIVQIAAGESHTLGLKPDGSVVTTGDNSYLQRNISWTTGIVQVAAGMYHTLGLKSDGTVSAIGYNDFHQCDVYGWTGIVQVAGGGYHTVGLESDGTVVAVGRSSAGQLDVGGWSDIVQVAAGDFHTVGLKSDGTVVAVGCAGGFDNSGQCDVNGWMLK